jgi:hypothetical protein
MWCAGLPALTSASLLLSAVAVCVPGVVAGEAWVGQLAAAVERPKSHAPGTRDAESAECITPDLSNWGTPSDRPYGHPHEPLAGWRVSRLGPCPDACTVLYRTVSLAMLVLLSWPLLVGWP